MNPHMSPHDGEKSSRRVIEVEDQAESHGPANQAAPHIAPKPTDPAASVATNKFGSDKMDGMRKKLTPSQLVKNSRHQAKISKKFEIEANPVGWGPKRAK